MLAFLKKISRMFQGLVGLVSCGLLAVLFYRTWQTPMEVEGGTWVRFGFAILGIEFVLNLAGVFLSGLANPDTEVILNGVVLRGARQQQVRRRALVVLFILFTVLGVALAVAIRSRSLLISFLGLMFSRAIGLWLHSGEANREQAQRYGLNLGLLFIIGLLTAFVPFSSGGLTPEVLAEVYPNRGTGLWADHPERVLVMGMIYFAMLGLLELLLPLLPKRFSSTSNS